MKKLVKFTSKKFRSGNSKGERLGWVSLKDAKSEKLDLLLSEKEALRVEHERKPLLVP